ncbi:DNA internalization-related competence protein ComEC/Rec2 [Curvibacter delicatus]|jgi:competence protein ComEC|uniref:DNA internalization-related competence protein ComEC/Rec2 n=1 Tax=Curvibacter delicatus TaxID=80879 RepID=UPI000834E499|nr:DNA internalization-related competence protein ComEC/Rec2 [Curvibacter delicatus]
MRAAPHLAQLLPPALAAWLAGVALQLQQPELWPITVYGLFLALALILIAPKAIKSIAFWQRAAAITLAFALLGFASTGLRATAFSRHTLAPALEGKDIAVTGLVAAMPQYSEAGTRFRFEVESAQLDGQPVALPPRLHLGWYGGVWGGGELLTDLQRAPQPLQAGERWQMTVRLKAPHGGSNPHGFDFELWLWEQGLQATGYVRAGPRDAAPQRLATTWWHPMERARQVVRDAIFERLLASGGDERERVRLAGVVAALVVGDQQAIDRADWDVFRATGVAHLMSISGLHVTLFAWLAAMAIGWLWRRSPRLCLALPAPTAGLLGGLLLAIAYALFSGWGVPAQRTVWMLATVTLLCLSARRWPWPLVWLLACAVVVAVDPWALLQAGFWLSFVAVGVLFATDAGTRPLGRASLRHRVQAMLREQWIITLTLTPLTLLLFGQVSLVSLVANVLAIPWVTLVVTPLALLGVLLPPLWEVAAVAVQWLTMYLGLLASLPLATLSVAQAPLWAGVAGLLGGVLLVMRLPWSLRLLGLPLLLPVLLWQVPRPLPGQFELLAADIGQGNAVLVQTATHALLFDAGPRYSRESDAGHRVLVPLLRALDVRLDRLVLSHRDSDHTGGAAAVLAMQPAATLLSSIEDDHELQALRRAERCEAGQAWDWDGVHFEVLHPTAEDYDWGRRSNALSCVLRISNGTQTALLTGDIEQAQEAQLLARGAPLQATVLLMPHHGSKTSSSPVFLDAVAPSLALVQAGYRNRFGHPAPPVLARYTERGVRVVDTPHCGAAHWQSTLPQQVTCQREVTRRYWQHRIP